MTMLSSIWDAVSDLAVVNCMSAGAAFVVNMLFPSSPEKDDDDLGPSGEPLLPVPTGGDWNWEEFNRELDKIGKEIERETVLSK